MHRQQQSCVCCASGGVGCPKTRGWHRDLALLSGWCPAASCCAGAVLALGLLRHRMPPGMEAEQGSGAGANPKPVAVCAFCSRHLLHLCPGDGPHPQPRIPSCVCPVLGGQLLAVTCSSELGDERCDVHFPGDGTGRENEMPGGQSPSAPAAGNVDFENVLFRAQLQKPLLLRWVWVEVKPQPL